MELYRRMSAAGEPLSPFWYYDVFLAGKRHRKSTRQTSKVKAQKAMVEAVHTVSEDAKAGPKRVTLLEACRAYLRNLETRKKRSAADVGNTLNKAFGLGPWVGRRDTMFLCHTMTLDAVTADVVQRLKDARMAEGKSEATLAQELKFLRSAAILAAKTGALPCTVKWDVPTPKSKTRWLTVEEWHRVYETLDPTRLRNVRGGTQVPAEPRLVAERTTARDLFVALTLSGGRWGEVSRLTVDQVIPGDPVRLRLYGWKTSKERMVPVPAEFSEVLIRRVAEAEAEGRVYLFPTAKAPTVASKSGAPPREWQRSSRAIRLALDRAGCNEGHIVARQGRATVHSLRHTFASWLRQDGVALGEIKELLGHESEGMTARYAHIAPQHTVDLASRVLAARLTKAVDRDTLAAHNAS